IEFDCFDHFAAQVIVVGFGHWAKSTVGQSSYDIVLTYLALAILLSGVVGIGIGDTAFFVALNSLGPRRALLMETLAPPMTAIGALIFLQEQLSVGAWCGLLLTILGVAWVVTERIPNSSAHSVNVARGISFGLLAALAMATGGILSRAVLANTTISPLWAALLRLIAAVLVLLPSIWLRSKRREVIKPEKSSKIKIFQSLPVIGAIFCAAFAGTYLGIWLQQTAIKFTATGIALTLTNTSPLFVLPLAIYLGEKVSFRAIAGAVIAISGIAVLFYLR
ncbi:MAG: DMT family transporter, partial [Gloeocapsa sp. UFS-A4-WI-NPMV-4B04]|nr:DMT family transporter [Gloeocapsa sp. UFS-A4-WI-NPMV-4B04]